MTFQNRRFTALAALSLVAGLGLTACGSDGDGESASGDGDLSITMLPKNLGNPYFDTSTGGAEDAAGELGASVEEVGPDTATPDAQVPFINTAAQQGADALIVSANDPTAICDALEEAAGAGTAIVTFDSDTDPECRDLYISQADAAGIAEGREDHGGICHQSFHNFALRDAPVARRPVHSSLPVRSAAWLARQAPSALAISGPQTPTTESSRKTSAMGCCRIAQRLPS